MKELTPPETYPRPVDPNVSIAKYSPSSIFSPASSSSGSYDATIGTDLPAWMMYGSIEWPVRFRIDFTAKARRRSSQHG